MQTPLNANFSGLEITLLLNIFLGRFLLRLSRIKGFHVISLVKLGPTAADLGFEFGPIIMFLRQPV